MGRDDSKLIISQSWKAVFRKKNTALTGLHLLYGKQGKRRDEVVPSRWNYIKWCNKTMKSSLDGPSEV